MSSATRVGPTCERGSATCPVAKPRWHLYLGMPPVVNESLPYKVRMSHDPLRQMRTSWQDLQARLSSGQISHEQFVQMASQLQGQDAQGRAWRIDGASGQWMWWDGQAWAPAAPPAAQDVLQGQVAEPGAPGAGGAGGPRTLAQLLVLLIKGIIKGIKRSLALRLMGALAVGGAVWLAHTFLLIGPNGGFNSDNWFLSHILALGGWKFFGGSMVWGLAVWIGMTLWSKRVSPGIMPFLGGVIGMPVTLTSSMAQVGAMSTALLLAGGTIGFLFGSLADSLFVGVQAAFLIFLSVASGPSSIMLMATRLGWSDLQRASKGRHPPNQFAEAHGVVIAAGIGLGFLATVITSNLPNLLVLVILVGLAIGTVALYSGTKPSAAMIALFATASFALLAQQLLADDGGWSEAGGTFGEWITSEGAGTAILVGLGPAGSAAGAFLLAATNLANLLEVPPELMLPPEVEPEFEDFEPPDVVDPNTGETHKAYEGESAVRPNADGTGYVPIVWDPRRGWTDVAPGARDADGQVWDPGQSGGGAWVSPDLVTAREKWEQDSRDFQDRERAKVDQHRRDVEQRIQEKEAREAYEARVAEAKRQMNAARRKFLEARQRALEKAQSKAAGDQVWASRVAGLAEATKWVIDTGANVVAEAAPPPAGTAFGYIYGGLTGAAEGMSGAYLEGGSMIKGGAMGAGEGLTTAFVGHMGGKYMPGSGGGSVPPGAFQKGFSRSLEQGGSKFQAVRRGMNSVYKQMGRSTAGQSMRKLGLKSGLKAAATGEGAAHTSSTVWSSSQSGGLSNARLQAQKTALKPFLPGS
jgi:hypothetical protein